MIANRLKKNLNLATVIKIKPNPQQVVVIIYRYFDAQGASDYSKDLLRL